MTKLKCDVCKEKHDRMHVVVECSNCYVKGCKKELKKQRQEIAEEVKEIQNQLVKDSATYQVLESILQNIIKGGTS